MATTNVLFIDDEINIVRACKRALRRSGYTVFTTTSHEEALQLAREHEFSVVVSDQRMPVMEGTELLELIRVIQPAAVRIILTGYADISAAIDAINRGAVNRFLTKPWEDEQLCTTIDHAVGQYNLIEQNRRLHVLAECQNEQLKMLNEGLEQRVADRTKDVTELSSRLEDTLKGALDVLGRLMEISSATVGNHSRRVADLSAKIGRQMNLSDDDLLQVEVAGLLHDIGKLTLPGQILRKDMSCLSSEEVKTLRSHTVAGETIVRAIPYLDEAARFVRHHHERFNGSGYPDSVSGTSIPLGARIVAVADAFDKQLNDRTDFSDRTVSDVVLSIRDRASTWFDPAVVNALDEAVGQSNSEALDLERFLELNSNDLVPGMQLADDVLSDSGAMLLKSGSDLTAQLIHRLQSFQSATLRSGVRVHRNAQSADAEKPELEMV